MQLHSAPSFRLDGKRALVSGAGRGIGLAAASALADAGAQVTTLGTPATLAVTTDMWAEASSGYFPPGT